MSSDRTTANKVTPVVPKDSHDRKLKPPPPDHHAKCPRCDSPNTKFCYYNNYSLSQPRHFCKTCRRYWTKGGALRNVPIGGGCRKNKKMKQRLAGTLDPRDSSSCEIMGSIGGGHNFFQGFLTPAMDFQLGSINPPSISSSMFPANVVDTNFSLYERHHNTSHLRSTTHHPSSNSDATLMSCGRDELAGTLQMGTNNNNSSMIVHSNLASSIESLSSINQELHWKLQQERLAAVLFPGDQSEKRSVQADLAQVEHQAFDHHHHHRPQGQTQKFLLQPILFQNLETTKEADHPYSTRESIMDGPEVPRKGNNGGGNNSATEWFLDANPYTNGRSNNNRGLNDDQGNNTMNQQAGDDIHHNNWNTGIQAWSDMQKFSGALP